MKRRTVLAFILLAEFVAALLLPSLIPMTGWLPDFSRSITGWFSNLFHGLRVGALGELLELLDFGLRPLLAALGRCLSHVGSPYFFGG